MESKESWGKKLIHLWLVFSNLSVKTIQWGKIGFSTNDAYPHEANVSYQSETSVLQESGREVLPRRRRFLPEWDLRGE